MSSGFRRTAWLSVGDAIAVKCVDIGNTEGAEMTDAAEWEQQIDTLVVAVNDDY